jgi:hypothetical protein
MNLDRTDAPEAIPETARSGQHDPYGRRRLWRWQERILPYAIGSILVMAVFFFVASLYQLLRLEQQFRFEPPAWESQLAEYEKRAFPANAEQAIDFVKWKTIAVMEQETMKRRYQQVNAAILTRVWTRYLGFLVGMIMALIGAIFVLSKLEEQVTKVSAEGQGFKGAFESASPGIVLAILGSVLVGITLVVPFEFTTRDVPVYMGRQSSSLSLPAPLDEPPVPDRPRDKEDAIFPETPARPASPGKPISPDNGAGDAKPK